MIVGVDEVGRGSWAGPLCVAAVALAAEVRIAGLTDSKLLSPKRRVELARHIRRRAAGIGIGWVQAPIIDQVGLTQALRLATAQALGGITVAYDEIVIDGTVAFSNHPKVRVLPKADLLIPAVSAASIIAKVARDTYMQAMARQFDQYHFAQHVGYGTVLHRAMLQQFGPCQLHRRSWQPIKDLLA